jgi:HEAT repeat protein
MPLVRKPTDAGDVARESDPQSYVEQLRHENPERRSFAARVLGKVPSSAAALGAALVLESDERVREAIFTSLAGFDNAEGFDAILPFLRSDDAMLRTAALDALRTMPEASSSHASALLTDPDPDIRVLACELAREVPSDKMAALLLNVIDSDPAVNVCAAAIDALAEIGTAAAIPILEKCLQRFPNQPFLSFAVRVAKSRLASGTTE